MMKRLVSVLLVVAFLFGLGYTVSAFVLETPVVADGPVYPPPIPTPWPPEDENSIVADGPVYPPPIPTPWPPENENSIVADGPVYPPPIPTPWPPEDSNSVTLIV